MKDTPPAIERKFRAMLLKRSGAERLKMGCSMHATARALAKAAFLQKHPRARQAELRRLLFLHLYSNDFKPEERKRIASALSKTTERNEATQVRVVLEPADAKNRAQVAERPASYRTKRPPKKGNER